VLLLQLSALSRWWRYSAIFVASAVSPRHSASWRTVARWLTAAVVTAAARVVVVVVVVVVAAVVTTSLVDVVIVAVVRLIAVRIVAAAPPLLAALVVEVAHCPEARDEVLPLRGPAPAGARCDQPPLARREPQRCDAARGVDAHARTCAPHQANEDEDETTPARA